MHICIYAFPQTYKASTLVLIFLHQKFSLLKQMLCTVKEAPKYCYLCMTKETALSRHINITMTGRKNRALQVPLEVSYKALENFSKAMIGTTRGTCSARFFRPVM